MKSDLCRRALAKVGDPHFLINLVSKRVRQLTTPGSSMNRPLLTDTTGLGAADIALREIIEDKVGWDIPAHQQPVEKPARRKRKR
jgi:hypothetical protein